MDMTMYRRKPPEVAAEQWLKEDKKQAARFCAWLVENEIDFEVTAFGHVEVRLADQGFNVNDGDWICRGQSNDWFPVPGEWFPSFYEEAQ